MRISTLLLWIGCTTVSAGCHLGPVAEWVEEDAEEWTPAESADDDDVVDDDDAEPPAEDDAVVVDARLPSSLECGEVFSAAVTVRNSGSTPWTRDDGHKLGAVDDDDPLRSRVRVRLDEGVSVEPGEEWTFEFDLTAPDTEGVHVTDWRMVHESVRWFGEAVSSTVDVACPGPPPLDLATVTWLHSDVSDWPVTADLASVTVEGGFICLEYDQADQWPSETIGGDTAVVANPWIFIYEAERWYGATWEWMRPGQTCKSSAAVAGDHIKRAPFGEASGWVPTSGETYGFMVSGLARFNERNVIERSPVVFITWP